MNPLDCYGCTCPWCGEAISLWVEVTQLEQQWSEDCPVCCQPMELRATLTPEGQLELVAERDNP
ncbi:CPXCG motif-containing cysteine-rich protein [Aestuariirhabdus litorea]|uniref:CPXCG motif-containing cysteine-rich protein n=1 Tax=Aestuariirhabdus litorea TaxID=2528527 RepID=A0A3P3VQF9_9GAMM|nr:CPXCG motif-containing cysteine-rich protein [Aestuariirhabdus litorea]RRJ83053.1 CPXCG motif-containing cysteine-rich protein [Aestuariirhabdus litorea]RWW93211.1 CPXCG motif-containing cysteine-rich protein [Endozoicomonadaceae bacterium GTF-13]